MLKNYYSQRNKNIHKESTRTREELANNEVNTISYLIKNFFNFEVKKELKVLDVGCGDKFLKEPFERKGLLYQGIDIDIVDFNNDKFPFPDNSFDLVVSLAVIEHIKNAENFLSEINRILKKGGFVFFDTPNWFYAFKNFYDDYTHVQPYTKKSLSKILRDYNFVDIHVVPGLRNKYFWQYTMPFAEFFARLLPFTGDAKFIPSFLKGKATSLFALAKK
jgi:2-polyprenyl-3-methyl-5-hydroxy-6-metoxy-1,4-benzoquinol methylase